MRFCSGKASKTFFRNYLLPLDTFRRNFFDAFPWDNLFWLFLAFFDPAWTVDCSREGNSSTGQKQCFRPYRLDDRKAQPEMGKRMKYVQVQVTCHWLLYLALPFATWTITSAHSIDIELIILLKTVVYTPRRRCYQSLTSAAPSTTDTKE